MSKKPAEDLNIFYYRIQDLIPYARNSRTHSDQQVNQIAASIKEFGFTNPILVDKDKGIIAGHGRLQAAIKLGIHSVPCIRLHHLTKTQQKAYVIADNQLAMNAGWNTDMLGLELLELQDEDFDLDLLGLDDKELDKLLEPDVIEGETDDDEVPEDVETRCKPGDIWQLGNHRLMCGDSTNIEHLEELMNGQKCQTYFTDPPYGDNVGGLKPYTGDEYKKRKEAGKSLVFQDKTIKNDKKIDWLVDVFNLIPSFSETNSTKLVFFKWDKYQEILDMAEAFGKPSALCVWDRVKRANNFFRFQPQHELCFHWGKQDDKKESISLSNVWHQPKEKENNDLHPTVKPIAILEPVIRVTTNLNKIVLDTFLGSGSTLIACEKTNRKCYGMELDPHYCDVIITRWENFTGKKADLVKMPKNESKTSVN